MSRVLTSPASLVPSPAVLRFLRIQTESLHFLSRTRSVYEGPRRRHLTCYSHTLEPPFCHSARIQSTRLQSICNLPQFASIRPAHNTAQHGRLGHLRHQSNNTYRYRPGDPAVKWSQSKRDKTSDKRPSSTDPPSLPLAYPDDNVSLGRVHRPTNELRLRCTEFDENGKVTLVNGEFKKSELIQKYGLLPRDLRKIDSSLLPHFLVRPSAILINLLHIRCLIKHNRVLVFDAYGSADSYTQSVFMYDLEGKLSSREARSSANAGLAYEFRALEAVMISVTSALEGEFEGVREPVVTVLRDLEENIDRDKLRHLLIFSKKLGTFEQKARLVRDAIDELLEADDDLADMYLSDKAAGRIRTEENHTEVEMLLESYHKVCDEIVQVSGNLVSNIRNTEEMYVVSICVCLTFTDSLSVKAILDANRNSLMLLDLKFTIGTMGLAAGTFIAALYGMNLKNYLEDSELGFVGVSVFCAVCTVAACRYGVRKLMKVQRLSMWGEGSALDRGGKRAGQTSRGSWRDVDPQEQLAGETRVDRR